jgi:hypothetical protein
LFAFGADQAYLGNVDLSVESMLALDVGSTAVKESSDGGSLFTSARPVRPNKK